MTHCWMSEGEWIEETQGQAAYMEWVSDAHDGTCLLPDGHDGPHVFTRDDIVIKFAAD